MGEMSLREIQEVREYSNLCKYASFSSRSKGRAVEEKKCEIRTVYQRDRDRILHCKAFRRLMHKTQVFLLPQGDHYRTRLVHTLEVSQNARTIARALRLNEDLTEAIALGHDLGHTPFGHAGEKVLNDICGFKHNEQSVRIVEKLEKQGAGLNLTYEVIDGIANHGTDGYPSTLEGNIVRLSDKIAYVNHDIDDAIRAQILREKDLPKEYTNILGHDSTQRLDTIIKDIIENSAGENKVVMSDDVYNALYGLRQFLFDNVYNNVKAIREEAKVYTLIEQLFRYYEKHPEKMPEEYLNQVKDGEYIVKQRIICDYIAGMTDRYAIGKFEELCIPSSWSVF